MNVSVLQAQLSISKQMLEHLNEIEQCIPHRDSLKPTVSKVDVAWHLDHSLKVINKIYEALESSQPSTYKYQFSWVRVVAFTMGDFPRGIAQSPQAVRPPEVIETEDLYAQLEEARNTLEKFMHLPEDSFYHHFAFKNINRDRSIRFIEVHTNHHLKIIRDILN